jgi:DNA modification methylase
MSDDLYVTDEAHGDNWDLLLGDSCERLGELVDNSVDLSVYSPPFKGLFIYSASPRDLGNSESDGTFIEHYSYIIREMLRVTKPGRNSCVHVADIATTKATHGVTGLFDLPGMVIAAHVAAGWTFYGRWFVQKNPQAVATRTKVQHLLFATKNRDSAKSAPANGDQLLLFKKPGDNAVPIPHEAITCGDALTVKLTNNPTNVSNEEWIEWAHPVWLGVRETHTLNVALAREDADERHLHPLALDFIERCVRLWSNPGELIVSPFGGVGSESYMAVKLGRCAWSCELKQSYWKTAVENMRRLDEEMSRPSLFDDVDVTTELAVSP